MGGGLKKTSHGEGPGWEDRDGHWKRKWGKEVSAAQWDLKEVDPATAGLSARGSGGVMLPYLCMVGCPQVSPGC